MDDEPQIDTRDFGEMTDVEIDAVLAKVLELLPPSDPADLMLASEAFADIWDEV